MNKDTSPYKRSASLDVPLSIDTTDALKSTDTSRSSSGTGVSCSPTPRASGGVAPSSPIPRRRGSAGGSLKTKAASICDLNSSLSCGSVHPKGTHGEKIVIKKSADGSMVKYQGGLKQSKTWMTNETVMTCDFNGSGRHLALGHKDGSISTFETSTGTKLYENRLDKTTNLTVTSLNFLDRYKSSEQNILLSTYSPGYTALWHVTSGNLLAKISEDRQVLASAVDSNCTTFCTTGYDCSIRIYNCDSFRHQTSLDKSISFRRMTGHVNRVFGVAYHPQSPNELVSAGWDGTIQFWDMRKSGSIRNISGTMVCGNSISINPVNFSIATGSWRPKESVQIWDYNTARLVKTIEPNFDTKVYSLKWMNGNQMVAGGAQTNNVVVIDAAKNMVVGVVLDNAETAEYEKLHRVSGDKSIPTNFEITGSMSGFKSGIYGVAYTPEYRKTIAVVSGDSCQLAVWREKTFMTYPIIPFEQKYK